MTDCDGPTSTGPFCSHSPPPPLAALPSVELSIVREMPQPPTLLALLPALLPVLLGTGPATATSLPDSFYADSSAIVDASATGANLSHPHPPCCKACPTGPCTACRTPGTGVCCPCLPPTPPLPPCIVRIALLPICATSPPYAHLARCQFSTPSLSGRLAPASCWWSRSGACTLHLPVFRPSPSGPPSW